MINTSANTIVYNLDGRGLHDAIRDALDLTATTWLDVNHLSDVDLYEANTKVNVRGAFPKFVWNQVLPAHGHVFGREYVDLALEAYRQKADFMTEDQFAGLMFSDDALPTFGFRTTYASAIHPALGMFLIALHSCGAITLPFGFTWPSLKTLSVDGSPRKRREVGKLVASELLCFVRSLDSRATDLPHPAFASIGQDRARRAWFLSYGTKLLLALGWHKAEDVNIPDLLAIKQAEAEGSIKTGNPIPLPARALLDVLTLAFGERVGATPDDWARALRSDATRLSLKNARFPLPNALRRAFGDAVESDTDLVQELLEVQPTWGSIKVIKGTRVLPGLDVDLQAISQLWIELEELYIQKTPRESYKQIERIFSWWNIYLFYYLPYWFARHPATTLRYPASPSLLLKSVFVSALLAKGEAHPLTFIEFMDGQQEQRNWAGNSYYGYLRQLGKFFDFIEKFSEEMPGCEGFTQPLSSHDYPRTSRPNATRKAPVPRQFFRVYLDYHEALLAHLNVVMWRILNGDIDSNGVDEIVKNGGVIDTFATAKFAGFLPLLFTPSRTIPLQFIPNVLDLGKRTLKDGRVLNLPQPHTLHQNLVALHTGIRHNHIQWLDRKMFDSHVDMDDAEFSLLFVNTDKQKSKPWTPHVSMRVIEVLRSQRAWLEMIGGGGFHLPHFYNDNSATKWPKFFPLFAYTNNGIPHPDQRYVDTWQAMLCGLQGLMPDLSEYGRSRRLLDLLPPGHKADDPELREKLMAYGRRNVTNVSSPLNVMSAITPHSARVTVVSQYITFLPADIIGKVFTGQKHGTVNYYVHLEPETIEAEQAHQALRLRAAALNSSIGAVLSGKQEHSSFIKADEVNCSLARSMRSNLEQTIASHGLMSISFSEDHVSNGIDALRKSCGSHAAANKTEICPHNNDCPREVVKQLGGKKRRCGLCSQAVRSVDHLPAVIAKKHQVAESIDRLDGLLSSDAATLNSKFSPEEIEFLDGELAHLCEDLAGWILNEEVLEVTRQRLAQGQENRTWVVEKPEIIARNLVRIELPATMTDYLLNRLGECISFPALEGPEVRARFDFLRRELLARAGNVREAFSAGAPIDPAAECAGLLRSIVGSTGCNMLELAEMLDQNDHLKGLPDTHLRLLQFQEMVNEV